MSMYWRLSIVMTFLVVFFSLSLVSSECVGVEPSSNSQALQKAMGIDVGTEISGPITMEADKLTYDQKGGFISLEGAVKIIHKNTTVQADKVIFYDQTKDVAAEGNVVLTEGEDVLRCHRLEFNIETKKGTVFQGQLFLKQKNFHITGSKAEKLGEAAYRIYDATLTSCDERVAPWKFTVQRLDVDIDGTAQGWWPGFRVLDVPILYFPWSIFPVKRERQSGFLLPDFSYSSKWGPELTIPFYWAIAPNQDATIYLERIGDVRGRGFKPGAEYRYAWSQQAGGEIKGFYIWDERIDKSRWSIFANHDQRFPGGYYFKTDINWVSDKDYTVDFDKDLPGESLIDARSRNLLESTFLLGKDWEWGALGTELSYSRDLEPDPDDPSVTNNRATMQRLPEMTFNLYQNRFLDTPLFYEMEAQGTYFWRQELPTNPALIKPGETLRGGRIDLYPRLSVPLKPLDIVRFEPWIGYRETIYFPDDPTGQYDKVTSREFYDVGASLATTISRVYALRGSRVQKLKHIVEPEVVYTFIPKVDQTDNPDFKYGLDRINSENAITWILTNYLIGKVVDKEGAVTYPEFLYLKLYQGYDASPDVSSEGRRHLSNFMAEARTAPFTWLSGTMNLEYNPHYRRLDVFNTGVNFADKRGDHVGVEYRLTRHQIDEISGEEINVEEINTELGIRIIDPLDFYFAYRHNLRDKVRIETVYGLDFRQQCWELTLRLHDINRSPDRLRDHEFKVMVYVTLTGLGKFRIK